MPKYLHPSVSTRIIDNSQVFLTSDGLSTLFQCVVSDIGPDNKLTYVTTPDEYLFHFGAPNLSKHGQAGYNVLNWLNSGGVAYVLRILPETATYAYTGVMANMAMDAAEGTAVVTMQHLSGTLDNPITSEADFDLALQDLLTVTADSATVPLGVVYPKGRGQGYNDLGIRFTLKTELDETYDFRTYGLYITAKDSLGSDVIIEGPFTVALDPLAKDTSNQALFWEKVVNKYSQFVKVKAVASAQETIAEELLKLVEDSDDINPVGIDVIFGKTRKASEEALYTGWTWINKNSEDSSAASVVEELLLDTRSSSPFKGGTDGLWEDGQSRESLMVRGYTGLVDSAILDTKFYEFDVILDGNESNPVKHAMGDLASNLRGDCIALLDVGFQADPAQSIEVRREEVNMSSRNVSVWAHDMEVFDSYAGSDMKVTTPYILASKIPEIDRDFGIQWPFVGPRRGIVSGVSNINFIPNPVWKDEMYKVQLNYIERDPKKYNFGTQLTSQVQTSALSDIPNVRVVLRIRREVEKMMADFRFEFQDDLTYDSMSSDLNGYLQKWIANRACRVAEGTVYASEYDRQQKVARVRIDLVFTGFIERIAVDIIVGK